MCGGEGKGERIERGSGGMGKERGRKRRREGRVEAKKRYHVGGGEPIYTCTLSNFLCTV